MSNISEAQRQLTIILPTHTQDRSTNAALLAVFSSRFPLLKNAEISSVSDHGDENRLLKINGRTFRFHYMTSALPSEITEEVAAKSSHLTNKAYLSKATGFYMIACEDGPLATCKGQQLDAAYLSCLAAALCTLQESKAVIWGATGIGFDAQSWIEATETLFKADGTLHSAAEREHLLWTQIQPLTNNQETKDIIGMRLDGMIPYIGREIEVLSPQTPTDELIDITLGLASYFFEHADDRNAPLPEGDGFEVQETISAADRQTPVYLLRPVAD